MGSRIWIVIAIGILIGTIIALLIQPNEKSIAIQKCIELCKKYNGSLENGPCLSENIIPGWVCDVAHNPRQPIDNDPKNQCQNYPYPNSHFVEVDPNCNFIRAL